MKKPMKQMSLKELIDEHKKLVQNLEGAKNQYHEQKKELGEYLREYAKLKGYAEGGKIKEAKWYPPLPDEDSKDDNDSSNVTIYQEPDEDSQKADDRVISSPHRKETFPILDVSQKQPIQINQGGKVGSGKRFAALEEKLSHQKGIKDPAALAAHIGREKYGKAKFQKLAHKDEGGPIYRKGEFKGQDLEDEGLKRYFGKDVLNVQKHADGGEIKKEDSKINPNSYFRRGESFPDSEEVGPYPDTKEDIESFLKYQADQNVKAQKEKSKENYADGGQVQESQQQQYQAKDYFGKGSNAGNSPSTSNAGGIAMTMADGGEVDSLDELSEKIRKAFKEAPSSTPAPETQDEKYARIREENRQRALGEKSSEIDPKTYAMGGPVTPSVSPMNSSANTASSLSPLLKETYASYLKKKPKKMSTGGWAPEQVPKAIHPLHLPGVSAPAEKKYPINIPLAPRIKIPKRLKPIGDIKGYDDGGDVKMDLGDIDITPSTPYPGEEEEAQKVTDFSTPGQLEALSNQNDVLNQIDQALGNQPSDQRNLEGMTLSGKEALTEDQSRQPSSDEETPEQAAEKEDQDKEQTPIQQTNQPFNALSALQQAQDARNKIQMWNQLGAIAERGAAQYANIKPTQQQAYQTNMAIGQQAVDDVKLRIAMEGKDPNSQTSQMARTYLQNLTGHEVDPNTTADSIKEFFPMINAKILDDRSRQELTERLKERSEDVKYHADALKAIKQMQLDYMKLLQEGKAEAAKNKADEAKEKADKLASDKAETELKNELFGFRQPPDVKQARLDTLNSNKALKTIEDYENSPGGLDSMNDQMAENVRGEVIKIAQSGAPTEGGLNKFDPNTFTGELSNLWQKFSNKPTGANAGAFLKQYKSYLQGMQQVTGSLVSNYNHSVLGTQVRKLSPDILQNYLDSDYVKPYEKYHQGQSLESGASNKTLVRKGYNAATNQTQFIYNDGTSEIKDGKL